jgi:hypothetical protein
MAAGSKMPASHWPQRVRYAPELTVIAEIQVGSPGPTTEVMVLVTDPSDVARVDYRAIDSLILATAASIFSCRPIFPYSAVARAGLPETPLPSKPPLSASLSLRMY